MQNKIKYNFLHFHWILNLWACPCMALWSFEITFLDQCADINNVGHMIRVTDYSSWIHWCGSDVAAARVWRSVFGPDPCVSCGQRGKILCCGPSARGHTEPIFRSPFPHSQRKYTRLCLCFRGLHCSEMWERQRGGGRRELIFYFPWRFRGFYEFYKKRMTPQSQQMVVWSRVFLKTICNSPRLKMFCGHPLCPQDCICPHIIKLSVHREQSGIAGPIEMFWHRHHAALSPDAITPVYLPKHNAIYLFIFLFILQNGFFFCLSLLNPPFFSPKEVPLFVADK